MISLGLLCIVLGWALQLVGLLQGEDRVLPVFVASYSVGVFLLVTAGYLTGDLQVANLNLLSLILSTCVLLFLTKRKHISQPRKHR